MNIKRTSLFLLVSLALSAGQAAADGQKKGFIVGVGLGAGHVSYTSNWSWETWKWRQYALAGNFKIGYAPSNSLELFAMSAGMSFRREGSADILSIVGVGLAKYFRRVGAGAFVTGGIGMSVLSRSYWGGSLETGFGGLFGLGYEFVKHLSIQGDVFVASLFRGNEIASGWRLTLNCLFY
jgi:hypothetical protein